MKLKVVVYTIILMFIVAFPMQAQETMPSIPALCYGELTINGMPAPVGIEVIAVVDEVPRGSMITSEIGKYGGPGIKSKLSINGEKLNGKVVGFYVSGSFNGTSFKLIKAAEANYWGSGEVIRIDLAVALADTSQANTGNDNSGGGGNPVDISPSTNPVVDNSSKFNEDKPVKNKNDTNFNGNTIKTIKDQIENDQLVAFNLRDVDNSWASLSINKLVSSGAIKGYPDGTFQPNRYISRAEFITVLVKAFGWEKKTGRVFNDTADHWAKDYIDLAATEEIISGFKENQFIPDAMITREQMSVIIVKAARIDNGSSGKTFKDNTRISLWAQNAVDIASANNILSGYPDQTFRPDQFTTRAEAATVIVKILQLGEQ